MGNPAGDDRQLVLRDFIEEVQDQFDFIICDCPPNIMIGSWAAMAAGDGVIVPLQAEDFVEWGSSSSTSRSCRSAASATRAWPCSATC